MRVFFAAILLISFIACNNQASSPSEIKLSKKIRGVSFVGGPHRVDLVSFIDLKNIKVNYVSLMPFAFARNGEPDLIYNSSYQWWGETPEGIQACIDMAREKGISSMIKPQIWMDRGEFVGFLQMPNDSAWKIFEEKYTQFILTWAEMSEKNRLPLFCIGTEVDEWVRQRPDYWKQLIQSVRQIYKGDLVYAANFGSEKSIPIWNELNYIGVDMYGPVSSEKTPTMDTLNASWKKYRAYFKNISDSLDRQIIFTEWGYRSDDYCGVNPWADTLHGATNYEAQSICYKALIENCYPESWFVGGFVWKWFPDTLQMKAERDHFSPQGKSALNELRLISKLQPDLKDEKE